MNIKANSVTSSLLMFLEKLMTRQKAILNIFANKMTKPKNSSTNCHFWIDNFLQLFLNMIQCVLLQQATISLQNYFLWFSYLIQRRTLVFLMEIQDILFISKILFPEFLIKKGFRLIFLKKIQAHTQLFS